LIKGGEVDWFEKLFGFREGNYEFTRQQMQIQGSTLRSRVNGRIFGIGELELVSLHDLRDRTSNHRACQGTLKAQIVRGDVRQMHQSPAYGGALFQVASQFNLLEMVGPDITPEHGVTRYQTDMTQGPACAMAAGAATIYRNYFVPVDGGFGQTRTRQLDGLADLGAALREALGQPAKPLWEMRNGYALCILEGLVAIEGLLAKLDEVELDALRGCLRIGVHRNVEVTDADVPVPPVVSQAFCSALPVRYSGVPREQWTGFATLVLEAAYDATLLAAIENVGRGGSNIVLLTRLGGGAFGNDDEWIHGAMRRALERSAGFNLDVRLVSYGAPTRALTEMAADFA
jgi:hypothetical protein